MDEEIPFIFSWELKVSPSDWEMTVFKKLVVVLSRFSRVRLFATLWTVARQAPLSLGSPRQEYWSGLPCPPPGVLPHPGIEPVSTPSPALQVNSLPLSL